MKVPSQIIFRLVLMVATTVISVPPTRAAPPPLEAFGQLPAVQSVKLSPDGTHYAAIQTFRGSKILVIYDMYGPPGNNFKVMTFDGREKLDEELQRFFWVNDSRLVAVVEIPAYRWGVEVMETRMLAMNRDLGDQKMIPKSKRAPKSKFGGSLGSVAQIQDRVLHTLPDESDHILIALDREGYGRELSVYKLNVYNGKLDKEFSGRDARIGDYEVDASGEVRIRYLYRVKQDDFITELRENSRTPWRQILDDGVDGLGGYEVEGFGGNPRKLYVSKPGEEGRQEIHELDLPSSTITRTVFSHPDVDAAGVAWDENGNRVIGISYQEHRTRTAYLDPVWAEVQKRVDGLLAGRSNSLWSKDRTGDKWSVLSSNENEPGTWYLYLKSENQVLEIGREYPKLMGRPLRPVEPFEFAARDGLAIPGYLTRPVGPGPYPTVVMPHGGPNSRDTMRFHYQAQFLASRGYAVFQPNFRGSTGYGESFEKAGHHQWGLAMQDDVTDGTRALIAQGIADPDRICIVGSSYGGYAALMGAVKTPDLYQCAASFGGVSDIKKLLAYWDRFRFSSGNDPRIGDRWDDRGRIRDTSPANNLDAIKIPILLIHGENDRRVPVDQSELMARRLKSAKKPHKLVIFESGDHHLSIEQNRIRHLQELEAFLDQHIGG